MAQFRRHHGLPVPVSVRSDHHPDLLSRRILCPCLVSYEPALERFGSAEKIKPPNVVAFVYLHPGLPYRQDTPFKRQGSAE
jgi:hypothetical protein